MEPPFVFPFQKTRQLFFRLFHPQTIHHPIAPIPYFPFPTANA
jgi:hypothetical protein